jgi:predicted nuclease with TOPRIM domain
MMVKQAVDQTLMTISKAWPMILCVASVIALAAVDNYRINENSQEIHRVNEEGCKKSHQVLQRLPVIETESKEYRKDIASINEKLDKMDERFNKLYEKLMGN